MKTVISLVPVAVIAISLSRPASGQQDVQPEASFQLPPATALRGEEVQLPFLVNATSELQGFSISVDFDEELLSVSAIEQVYARPDGEDWDFYAAGFNNENDTPGNDGARDEGFLYAAGVFDFFVRIPLPPPDTNNEILSLGFRVSEDAPVGVTEIRFEDGAPPFEGSPGVENVATLELQSAELTVDVTPLSISARLGIVGDVILFVRGDTDGNRRLEATDAIMTLDYLYRGEAAPACFDAADFNDDGEVDISDPVGTLMFLYVSGGSVPPPYPAPGRDPSPDSMVCD